MILKRNYKTVIFTAFFTITIFSIYSISYAFEPQIIEHNFEEVELNTKKTATVSISTSSGSSVVLKNLWFENGSYFQFVTDIDPEGLKVSSEAVDVGIAFTPEILGLVTDTLYIGTEDSGPSNPYIAKVILSGTGISKTDITIYKILYFFNSSVASGSLIGKGGSEADDHLLAYTKKMKQNGNEGKSAENKLAAYRNMLESAGKLIESEDLDEACRQLTSISKKCDGKDRPPDFVLGAADEPEPDPVPILNNMIVTLSESLNCE